MPFKLTRIALVASLLASSLAAPAPIPQSGSDGQAYQCPTSSNAPARKAYLQSISATDQDLAITVLETSCDMNSSYPYGDVYPASSGGAPKTGDAANFGLFKNNWLQIRTYCDQFMGQGSQDWNNGAALNSDDAAAILCQHQQQERIPGGISAWWGAQRGCSNGDDYATAVSYVKGYLDQGHLNDDWVTYYNLANC